MTFNAEGSLGKKVKVEGIVSPYGTQRNLIFDTKTHVFR
jgi:hypothetical protein